MSALAPWIQYVGMAIAMVAGAPWPSPRWWLFGVGLAVMVGGIVMQRLSRSGHMEHGHGGHAPAAKLDAAQAADAHAGPVGTIDTAFRSLAWLVHQVSTLREQASTMELTAVASRIEVLQNKGTEQFAAAQEALVRKYGFAGYSKVMSPLANAERWLYRAWSAASDGHREETIASLQSAMEPLQDAGNEGKALETPEKN